MLTTPITTAYDGFATMYAAGSVEYWQYSTQSVRRRMQQTFCFDCIFCQSAVSALHSTFVLCTSRIALCRVINQETRIDGLLLAFELEAVATL